MRRDKNDKQWQDCKKEVYKRDKSSCLLCECLSVAENIKFQESNPEFSTYIIDPAHHLPVSLHPELMYNPDNVFCLCRCHHERLDHCRNPVTGEICTSEVTEEFWQRIINKRKENLEKEHSKDFNFFYVGI